MSHETSIPPKSILGPIFLISCLAISMIFPGLMPNRHNPRPATTTAIVVEVSKRPHETSRIVTYQYTQNGETRYRSQVFSESEWTGLTVGSQVQIAYDPSSSYSANTRLTTSPLSSERVPLILMTLCCSGTLIFGLVLFKLDQMHRNTPS